MTTLCRPASGLLWLALLAPGARADTTWIEPGADGQPVVHLYFFWSLACRHCLEAQSFIEAIPSSRLWVKLHSLELTRHPENVRHYVALADPLGQPAQYVPALLAELDACRAVAHSGSALDAARAVPAPALRVPRLGEVKVDALSLPLMTALIAGLDAYNPCAFFVLLFLLSLMAHRNSRARMLAIGGVFVLTSGLMYFAFMAAWLNLFQLLGSLAWVTLVAGAMALAVGLVNVKDFFTSDAACRCRFRTAESPRSTSAHAPC